MIKVGDKVICIKDYIYYGEWTSKSYTKGTYYEILTVEKYSDGTIRSYYVLADMTVHDDFNSGLRFSHLEKQGNSECFEDYFMTIAEWRDKQINSILND